MKYRLMKDIGMLEEGFSGHTDSFGLLHLKFGDRGIAELIKQGYIEEVQEPWATDKDMIDFWHYYAKANPETIERLLELFKKERGR